MKLVVAEKPSVMRDIAAVIGANERYGSALKGNGYIVTSARGHLVRLKEPHEYNSNYKKWELSHLPIVPDFAFLPLESGGAAETLDNLAELMNSSEVDEIIEATDAEREGECIFRYIYNYIGCTKPVRRLWISSMTEASIRQGFSDLKPMSEYDGFYNAGFTRSKIDWLWGYNLSRLFSLYSGTTCSIGRVMTPVLNILVKREEEINGFVKRPFYKVKLDNGAEWFSDEQDSFEDKSAAESVKAKCENKPCKVISVASQKKKENRPLLFSLTSLQIQANDELGYSAAKTLAVMQSLYEKKLLTYPRTDSNYLTDDIAAVLPDRVRMLRAFDEEAVDTLLANGLNIDSRVINNSKVSDHHAIIPTEYIGNAENTELTSDEKAILALVIRRFFEALSPQYEYSETEYIFEISGETFKARRKIPVKLGWRVYKQDDKDNDTALPYAKGDTVTIKSITVSECETKPPKRYTESTLLKVMENIDRRIEDKELSEYVSERGLGTPATRAAVIEKILGDGYAERKNKAIVPTETGKKIIAFIPEIVKSVEMTAKMEQQLSAIKDGTLDKDVVIDSIINSINEIIRTEATKEHKPISSPKSTSQRVPLGKCPKCGGDVYKFSKDNYTCYYCENTKKGCFFRVYEDDLFFTSKGKKLTEVIIKAMLSKGKAKVSGFISSKTNKPYDATVLFKDREDKNGNQRVGFELQFDNKPKGRS